MDSLLWNAFFFCSKSSEGTRAKLVACKAHLQVVFVLASASPIALLPLKRTDVAPGKTLRILPLGNSIAFGYLSPDGNGYRLKLLEDLIGTNFTFIGSVRSGNMTNNQNEGHPGATISQIQQFANNSLPEKPNLVLIHAGTNNMNDDPPNEPYASAPKRLGSLIDAIVAGAAPNALVLVAQIIQAGNDTVNARIATFNDAVPEVVAQRAALGQNVEVIDFRSITPADLQDGLHPTEEGYLKMGDIWFVAIYTAAQQGAFGNLVQHRVRSRLEERW